MADTYTPKLGLRKPATQATVDVGVINDNYDLIDNGYDSIDNKDLSKFGNPKSTTHDWNAAVEAGIYYMPSDAANAPAGGGYMGLVLTRQDGVFSTQVALKATSTENNYMYMRASPDRGATWNTWEIVHGGVVEVHNVNASGEPAPTNGWVNYSDDYERASFYRVGEIVYISGVVRDGNVSKTFTQGSVFRLPVGYRPTKGLVFSIATAGAGSGRCTVTRTGYVVITAIEGTTEYVSLSGISFRVDI